MALHLATGDRNMERVMMVIGKTGNGKSATCNTVLEMKAFKEGKGGMSTTCDCKLVKKTVRGRTLSMIDTPGTMDVRDPILVHDSLMKAMDLCNEGVDAFLVTFRCDVKATEEELTAAEQAVELFGPECFKRAIMVFTRGGEFKNDETKFVKNLSNMRSSLERFDALLSRCSNRWVLMDNGKGCDPSVRERQVNVLLSKVDDVAMFNPRRYHREDQESQQLALRRRDQLEDQYLMAMQRNMFMQAMTFRTALMVQSREFGYTLQALAMQSENERLRDQILKMEIEKRSSGCTLM